MKKLLLMTLCLLFQILQSEIVEICHMNEIETYIKPETFIIFDIDNTLVEPTQEFGTDQWFYYQLNKSLKENVPFNLALKKTLSEWHAAQLLTNVKIVEKGTEKIISNLQEKKFCIIGLTTRGLELSSCTAEQLENIGIDLSITAPLKKETFFLNPEVGVLFDQGILFTRGTNKGTALFKLLDQINYHPSHIIFINDKATHLKDVENSCIERNISFIGLRYGYLDEKIKNFNTQIADRQFKEFAHILSDEEARKLCH